VASLILSLEAVISVIAAWIILQQSMSSREILGAGLMFAAIILAQLPERTRQEMISTDLIEETEMMK
jgi:drug/metabolite transporter (DMT)-like permease